MSFTKTKKDEVVGKRIRMIEMVGDPEPIEQGDEGIVTDRAVLYNNDVLGVKWDSGRTIGVLEGIDKYEIIE